MAKWKNNRSGELVEIAFPVPDKFKLGDVEITRDDFISAYTFQPDEVRSSLPAANPSGLPTMAVSHQPGNPIATPKPALDPTPIVEKLEEIRLVLEDVLDAVKKG